LIQEILLCVFHENNPRSIDRDFPFMQKGGVTMAMTAEQLRKKARAWAEKAKAAEQREKEIERKDRTRALVLAGKAFIDMTRRGEIDPGYLSRVDFIVKQGKGTRDLRYAIEKELTPPAAGGIK
jgi:hypothetical protein